MNTYYSAYPDELYQEAPEKPSRFKRFFFACAGAYMRILEVCPSEHTKYVGIGATIFLTACLAVLSGSFAIYTLVDNWVVACLFGLLWGAMIFNLDRYIVSSIRKEGKLLNELALAMPRLLLAVLISVVITKPLEVELFRNQINSGLLAVSNAEERKAEGDLNSRLGLDSIYQELDRIDSLRIEYKKVKEGRPTTFNFGEVSAEYNKAKTAYDSLYRIYTPRIQSYTAERGQLWEKYATKVFETNSAGDKVFVRWNFPYQDRSDQLGREIKRMQTEMEKQNAQVLQLDKEQRGVREAFAKGLDEEIQMLQTQRDELAKAKEEKEAQRREELPATIEKARRYSIGFPAKIKALEQMKQEDGSIWWMSNLIVMLFILLETSPIFVKLISKRGPYDYLLNRIEHHKRIESLRYISDMNYDLNAALRLQTRRSAGALGGPDEQE